VIHNPWHISVLIPARNEEELLPRCLDSVLAACAVLPCSVTSDVIVAVDSSNDMTHKISEQMLRGHGIVVLTQAGIVGSARALAAKTALERYVGPRRNCWLANTDADCCVPRTWLIDQLALAEQNVQAIAGIVEVDSFAEHSFGVALRFRDSYLIQPDGSHPHVHGANMGVRADAYLRAGGWGDLETAEDHDLWKRLRKIGSRHLSVDRVKVLTSGRRVGRAPHGFAGALAAHNEVPAC
jgi:cellulose synthase/poly-beta-1,6-N-acetylglucosamine synthase-like glycosyltransferase